MPLMLFLIDYDKSRHEISENRPNKQKTPETSPVSSKDFRIIFYLECVYVHACVYTFTPQTFKGQRITWRVLSNIITLSAKCLYQISHFVQHSMWNPFTMIGWIKERQVRDGKQRQQKKFLYCVKDSRSLQAVLVPQRWIQVINSPDDCHLRRHVPQRIAFF